MVFLAIIVLRNKFSVEEKKLMAETTATSGNKYVRSLVTVVVGVILLVALLYLGDVIAAASSGGESYGVTAQSPLGDGNILQGWLFWVIVGGIILFVIYAWFAQAEMFKIGTREVVMMALGAALYGVLSWVFNIVPVPSVSLALWLSQSSSDLHLGLRLGFLLGLLATSLAMP
jgi:hypothetical protein